MNLNYATRVLIHINLENPILSLKNLKKRRYGNEKGIWFCCWNFVRFYVKHLCGHWTLVTPRANIWRCCADNGFKRLLCLCWYTGRWGIPGEVARANWKQIGLRNLAVNALAIHRQVPGTVFVGVQSNGLLVSPNGGLTWTETNLFTKDSILDIEWHPKSPDLICLVGYLNEIAISRD